MRDHSGHIEVTREEALEIILSGCTEMTGTQTVPVGEAAGRVAAEDIISLCDVPNCLTCRMDSIAVHWDDFKDGIPDTSAWVRGADWEFANTGIAMPEGFDTAIVVEHVVFSEDDTKVTINAAPSDRYAGTAPAGSRMKEGSVIVKRGTRMTPGIAAAAAGGNNTFIKVLKKPVVAFIPTGNELVPASGTAGRIPNGKNIETNSIMIAGKIREWGAEPMVYDIVPDKWELIKKALIKASEEADIIVINAGSSKGSDDLGIEVLEEIGEVRFHQINHGPGHHSSFSILNGKPVIGISGPPGGAGTIADLYLYPAVMKSLGQKPEMMTVRARLKEDIKGHVFKSGKDARGEERPSSEGKFNSIRIINLCQGPDGMPEAKAAGRGHPGAAEGEAADGYYIMPTGPDEAPSKAGDIIEVILKPRLHGVKNDKTH